MYHKLTTSLIGAVVAVVFAATATLAATDGGRALWPAGAPAFGLDVTGTVPVTPTPTITGTAPLTPTPTVSGTTSLTNTLPPGQFRIASALAARFGLTLEEVMAVRDEKQGWGGVFKVLLLAELTGKTPDEILAMRQDQQGWGQIFHTLNVMPKKKDNLGQALKGNRATPTATASAVAPSGRTRKPALATPVPTRTPKPTRGNSNITHGNGQGHGNGYGPDNNPGSGKRK